MKSRGETPLTLQWKNPSCVQCLVSLAGIYRELTTEFDVPQRISLESTSRLVVDFLRESSGGERPQVVTAALMRTIGNRFGIFDEVVRQAINEAMTPPARVPAM